MRYNDAPLINYSLALSSKSEFIEQGDTCMKIEIKNLIKNWWLLIAFILFLIATGILLLYYHWVGDKLSEAIGHALIIAGFLIAPIDYCVKKHLVEDASKDIAKFVVGHPLPYKVRSKIVELLDNRLIVHNTVLVYEIIPDTDNPNKITLKVERRFEIENIGESKFPYQQYIAFEKHTEPKVEYMSCYLPDGTREYHRIDLKSEEIEKGVLKFTCDQIKIKPKAERSNERYKFETVYSYKYPAEYNEHFFFALPAIGATIKAKYPPEFEFFSESNEIPNNENFVYQQGFLSGQQIGVRWRRKANHTEINK